MEKQVFIITVILFLVYCPLKSQSQNTDDKPESICVVIYDGKNVSIPPIPPKFPDESEADFEKRLENQRAYIDSLFGGIDVETEMSNYSPYSMDKKGKFNPTIEWELKKCFTGDEMKEVLDIIISEKDYLRYVPTMCFYPKHSVWLYKKGEIILHYDICFECYQTRLNGERGNINTVDYGVLEQFFKQHEIPIKKQR